MATRMKNGAMLLRTRVLILIELKHVDAKPGDAIIFTEALAHGSMTNKTNKVRRVLSYCYSVGYMPDWTKLKLEYSKEYLKRAPKKIKKLIKLYKD